MWMIVDSDHCIMDVEVFSLPSATDIKETGGEKATETARFAEMCDKNSLTHWAPITVYMANKPCL